MKTITTNDIITRQNNPEHIELLKAQRQAYTESKKFLLFDVLTPLLALLLTALMIYKEESEFYCAAISTVAVFIYAFIIYIREKRNRAGAIIQEEFDTTLFDLGWNEKIAEFKARLETKNKLRNDEKINLPTLIKPFFDRRVEKRRLSGAKPRLFKEVYRKMAKSDGQFIFFSFLSEKYKKGKLDNWYSHEVKDFLPHNIAVLFCQRINIAWEVDLKKNYTRFWIALAVVYYIIMFFSFLWCNVIFHQAYLLSIPAGSNNFSYFNVTCSAQLQFLIEQNELLETKVDFNNLMQESTAEKIKVFEVDTHHLKIEDFEAGQIEKVEENAPDILKQLIGERPAIVADKY